MWHGTSLTKMDSVSRITCHLSEAKKKPEEVKSTELGVEKSDSIKNTQWLR